MVDLKNKVRIAAMGDLHVSKSSQGSLKKIFEQAEQMADILLLCGDLTDYGLPEEAHILAKEFAGVKIPTVGVLGNHDFESGKQQDVTHILTDAGLTILDGEAHEVRGVGFAGVKGFAGGFGRGTLGAWGEEAMKRFVHEAVEEALKLEGALARLRTTQRIALLHYSPIAATIEGEPREIFPYLGTSRLEDPLTRYPVTAVFHGHAHRGSPEGATRNNVPVYNVAMPLLKKLWPEKPPFRLIEVSLNSETNGPNASQFQDAATLDAII